MGKAGIGAFEKDFSRKNLPEDKDENEGCFQKPGAKKKDIYLCSPQRHKGTYVLSSGKSGSAILTSKIYPKRQWTQKIYMRHHILIILGGYEWALNRTP
ncbi:hypothetical protein HYU14_04965 [Candidatus Woesearchaeota archaeon]|nr:hypothetical protein [Candidatus Woesearchaeota archaeon]